MDACLRVSLVYHGSMPQYFLIHHGCMPQSFLNLSWLSTIVFPWSSRNVKYWTFHLISPISFSCIAIFSSSFSFSFLLPSFSHLSLSHFGLYIGHVCRSTEPSHFLFYIIISHWSFRSHVTERARTWEINVVCDLQEVKFIWRALQFFSPVILPWPRIKTEITATMKTPF